MGLTKKKTNRYASTVAFHPCMQGGPCQCGGGCGQQPLMIQPDYGLKEGDGESYMSVQALQSMRDHAEELLNRVDHGSRLPDWVESKLTRAAQSLNDVYEYMSHGKGKHLATGEMNKTNKIANILREEGLLKRASGKVRVKRKRLDKASSRKAAVTVMLAPVGRRE